MNEENGGTPFNMNVVPAGMGGYGDGFGMNGGNSGHMPMQQNPYYPEPKRW